MRSNLQYKEFLAPNSEDSFVEKFLEQRVSFSFKVTPNAIGDDRKCRDNKIFVVEKAYFDASQLNEDLDSPRQIVNQINKGVSFELEQELFDGKLSQKRCYVMCKQQEFQKVKFETWDWFNINKFEDYPSEKSETTQQARETEIEVSSEINFDKKKSETTQQARETEIED
ncbi:hypothetical protein L484_016244 [Morus notabilis]|uniref:Uncharacterized protein n=1 Tax=Morus notabilis TaxID=981085 RepID=W9R0D3_9ROSA|nr:hypothetical protein L484_016244 [Morus notabilis]